MPLKPRAATAPTLALALVATLAAGAAESNTALAQLAPERTGGGSGSGNSTSNGSSSGGGAPPARSPCQIGRAHA